MSLALTPRNMLAASLDAGPVGPTIPPDGRNWGGQGGEPDDGNRRPVPGYLAIARSQAANHKESITALARLAQAELSAGNAELAGAVAGQALLLDIAEVELPARLAAAEVLRATGNPREARARLAGEPTSEFERGLKARLAIDCGDLDEARELLRNPETYEALTLAAWLAIHDGSYANAIVLLRRALARSGPTAEVLTNLGFAHASLGQLRHAIRDTRQAQAIAPTGREAVSNLVSYYQALGDFDGALHALEPLERARPGDIWAAIVRAHVTLRSGDRDTAWRVLQRARTSTAWATTPTSLRVELDASLGWLRWINGKRTADETLLVLLEELDRSGYKSLSIASLLPSLLTHSGDQETLASVIHKLAEHHDPEALVSLRLSESVLRKDAPQALLLATEWTQIEPLNPQSAAIAVQLIDALGDSGVAIDIGLEALKRIPGDPGLCNNLAYVLAWQKRFQEARSILSRVHLHSPTVAVLATGGLIDLLAGETTRGLQGYRRAREIAEARGETKLAKLVDLNRDLAVNYLRHSGEQLPDAPATTTDLQASNLNEIEHWLLTRKAEKLGLTNTVPAT